MNAEKKPKVAVVAVHGVGYHEPGESADAVSELLLGLPARDDGSTYGPFAAETVHIPLRPLEIRKPLKIASDKRWPRFFGFLQERTVFLTAAWPKLKKADREAAAEKKENNTEVANDFMRLLLQDYRGAGKENPPKNADDSTAYTTTRLAGAPPKPQGSKSSKPENAKANSAGVDVYEMYWADLSRPDNTISSFFQGLYQVLIHLASLSRLAISTGSREFGGNWVWWALDSVQTWAVRMLTLPIPILSLILLIALLGTLSRPISTVGTAQIFAVVVSGLLGLVVCLFVSRILGATPSPVGWVLIPCVFLVGFAGIAWLIVYLGKFSPWSLLGLEGWIIGTGGVYLCIRAYDKVRDGAWEVAWGLYVLGFLTFVWRLFCRHDASIEQATLRTMQIIIAELRASWILFIFLAFVALVLGSRAWRKTDGQKEQARAKASVRTSRLGLAMPALGIMIVTLALWSGLFVKATTPGKSTTTIATALFGKTIPEPLRVPYGLDILFVDKGQAAGYLASPVAPDGMAPNDYFKGVLIWSSTPGFAIVLLFLSAGLFLLILWALPSVLTERDPPRGSNNASSIKMGRWLSRGLDATAIVTWLVWCAAFVVTVVFPAVYWLKGTSHYSWMPHLNYATALILTWLGLALGSFSALAAAAKSGSAVLDITRDVDSYLRTSPKDRTPRARIVERYVSLLRYLAAYTDEKGEPYTRIVIVAHSLGALISGDLLLFLKQGGELDQIIPIPLFLFTMGNPTRQLLNRFFPYLYKWVRLEPDNGLRHLGKLPQTPIGLDPDPGLLGVELWVNAYRSGDYVGRSLWYNERYDHAIFPPVSPQLKEMCIGAGAHVHYWDESAPDIAEMLDQLIQT
ncbi:MAG TPA: hypothetical protein VGT03_05140 [Candidatus Acidoferrales bacterium]|nr:hypothetical protein [Candidatus Acidoferrales bacterium]